MNRIFYAQIIGISSTWAYPDVKSLTAKALKVLMVEGL
jgi:hypothetical protein